MFKREVSPAGEDGRGERPARAGGPSQSHESEIGVPVTGNLLESSPMNSVLGDLPERYSTLVVKALRSANTGEFVSTVKELIRFGGYDAAKSVGVLLSEASREEGALASLDSDRQMTVYRLCHALLRIAGAGVELFPRFKDIEPEQHLSQAQKREVLAVVKFLALGDHGDIEAAAAARMIMLERWSEVPIAGKIFETLFDAFDGVHRFFSGRSADSPPMLLFVLADLPWALWSRIPFASVESRGEILDEIISRR